MSEFPQPYWFVRATPPEEVGCAVVGGGIVGLSTAWWAARAGEPVVVLEAGQVASGATGRNTGFLLTGTLVPFTRLVQTAGSAAARALWRLTVENQELLRAEVLSRHGQHCGWEREGSWRAGRPGSDAEAAWRESAGALAREGFPGVFMEAAEVRRMAPGGAAVGGAFHVAGDGGIDPLALGRVLAAAAGVAVRPGVRVRRLEAEADRVVLEWAGGRLRARRVVVAVNGAIGALVPQLGRVGQPYTIQALAACGNGRQLSGCWAVGPEGLTVRQLGDGTVLAAGSGQPAAAALGGYLELPTASAQAALQAQVRAAFPGLSMARVVARWAGAVVRTADGIPRIGTLPDSPTVAFASGFNGQGMALGFAVGRRLAVWLRGGTEDPSPFSPPADGSSAP